MFLFYLFLEMVLFGGVPTIQSRKFKVALGLGLGLELLGLGSFNFEFPTLNCRRTLFGVVPPL